MRIFTNQGPWGQFGGGGNNSGGGGGGGKPPFRRPDNGNTPDIDKIIRDITEKFKNQMGGGNSKDNKSKIAIFIIGLLILWLSSGIYKVDTREQGVVMRFGAFNRTSLEGLNYRLPSPIENVIKVKVTEVNQVKIDNVEQVFRRKSENEAVTEEGLRMLTGDENLVEVSFAVQWQVSNAADYLFNLHNPVPTISAVAESAMREVIGQSSESAILSSGRAQIESKTKTIMQRILDSYKSGVVISSIQIKNANPPAEVKDAYQDVQTAGSNKENSINEANAYSNKVVTEAKGQVAKLLAEANAYSIKVVENATGEASRFNKVYDQYYKAKDVTKSRMYFETMENVLKPMNKIIIDSKTGALPYIPLDQIKSKPNVNAAPNIGSYSREENPAQYSQEGRQ